jgi:hypothetical protein
MSFAAQTNEFTNHKTPKYRCDFLLSSVYLRDLRGYRFRKFNHYCRLPR